MCPEQKWKKLAGLKEKSVVGGREVGRGFMDRSEGSYIRSLVLPCDM